MGARASIKPNTRKQKEKTRGPFAANSGPQDLVPALAQQLARVSVTVKVGNQRVSDSRVPSVPSPSRHFTTHWHSLAVLRLFQ